MSAPTKVRIVGIGSDGLDGLAASVRHQVESAQLLIGDARTLQLVPVADAERSIVGADLDEAVRTIVASSDRQIVVLAPGDPLFYGLARYLCDQLGKDRFEIEPHVSSMQLAFARVMESWEEAYLTNLANHSLESVVERIRVAEKVGLFTTDQWPPARVAQALLDEGIDYFQVYLCENLGSPDERVTQGALDEIVRQRFAPLNVMILLRMPDAPDRPVASARFRLFGNRDELFLQSKPKHGLLTPAEVRAVALAEMALTPASIVWDVGAGSGSVSVEAAQIATRGTIYAMEMDAEEHGLIEANARRFGVANVVAVLGRAPEAWSELPDPDSVFVEGSGREIVRIVDLAYGRLHQGGHLVANVGSLDSLADLYQTLSRQTGDLQVWMINLARGTDQLERIRFDALNPTFLLSATKTALLPPHAAESV